jgi:multicomponent Na+:H+ antiporter subunit G
MTTLGWVLGFLGLLVLLVAALGLLRLPDALSRQHAATKAGTLGLGLLILGVGLASGQWTWVPRLLLLLALLMLTLPLASHALARAAAREAPESPADGMDTGRRGH